MLKSEAMAENLTNRLIEISGRLQTATTRYTDVAKQAEKLLAENKRLKEEKEKMQGEIRMLREEVFLLKASLDPMEDKDKKEFQKIINEYLKTIDKCISILKN